MLNLQSISKSISDGKMIMTGRIPGQIVVQFTNACNAKCPQCGMNSGESYSRSKMAVEDAKRLIDYAAANRIKAMSFTGGEPCIYFDEVVSLIRYAGEAGIDYIRTGTNGFMMMHSGREDFMPKVEKMAQTLSETKLRNFWISVDSAVPEIHEQMRGLPGVIKGIEKALPVFHQHGIYPSANLGINRNIGGSDSSKVKFDLMNPEAFYEAYREAFGRFFSFVTDMGFTTVNMCYPMSVDSSSEGDVKAVYAATSPDDVVRFTAEEKKWLFKALFDTIPEFRSKIRIFTPLSALYAMIRHYGGEEEYAYPCRGGIDFFFVDAVDGNTYPCGYRGNHNYGKLWDIDFRKIDRKAYCRLCDWECYRDLSELLGPALELFENPLHIIRRFIRDRRYARLWQADIAYYKACRYFDGRIPPNYGKMKQFKPDTERSRGTF